MKDQSIWRVWAGEQLLQVEMAQHQPTFKGSDFVTEVAVTTDIIERMEPPIHILKYFDLNHGVGKGPARIKKNQKQSSIGRD